MFATGTASNYADLLQRLNTFLSAKGSAFGLAYAGAGNGTLTGLSGGASSVAETFTLTATSPTSFSVVGSLAGSIGPATIGTPFVHARLELLLTAGSSAFQAGDVFTLSTAPPWLSRRKTLGARVTATQVSAGRLAAANLVDGKNALGGTGWQVNSPITLPQDVEFTFFEAETIASYQLAAFDAGYTGYLPSAWDFQYWTGSAWTTLDSRTGQIDWTPTGVRSYAIGAPVSATRYRLHITAIPWSTTMFLGAVRLLRASGVDAAFSQVIWEAPGNDGNSQILCGAHAFERQDADYFDWELASFDGYLASSLWRQQAGFQGKALLPLWNDAIPYWFIANGRRAIIIAKIGTQYEMAYLGLLDPYFSPQQWPYPAALGAPLVLGPTLPDWNSTAFRWSNATGAHRSPTHADAGSNTDPAYFQLRVRNWDGNWLGVEASVNDLSGGSPVGSGRGIIWPYRCGISLLDANLDGSYCLWPVMLNLPGPNTVGQLGGVAAVTGQGLAAESLIRLGAVDWMVLPNVTRTSRGDFCAVALD